MNEQRESFSGIEIAMMGPWSGQKILIVDDSEFIRNYLKDLYGELGMTVVGTAANGCEAIEQYDALQPDVVSLDIIMPEMHGLDCYSEFKESRPGTKILFVSCLVVGHIISDAVLEEIPRELFVSKPAQNAAVINALEILYGVKEPGKLPVRQAPEEDTERSESSEDSELPPLPVLPPEEEVS